MHTIQSSNTRLARRRALRLRTLTVFLTGLLTLLVARPAQAQFDLVLATEAFSDAAGWNLPQYYSTIQFPKRDGVQDACGRGVHGIVCVQNTTTYAGPIHFTFPPTLMTHDFQFSDAYGWGTTPAYYSTIRFADINGDGSDDVCGRGRDGIICRLYDWHSHTFDGPNILGPAWSDAAGWQDPAYYTTIQFVDINQDGRIDVCARGSAGVLCALSSGTAFGSPTLVGPIWSNSTGGNRADIYSTLQFADINGDAKPDLCGRTSAGIRCALNATGTGSPVFTLLPSTQTFFDDAHGWTRPEQYRTIRFVDVTGPDAPGGGLVRARADVCGRHSTGIVCAKSLGTAFETALITGPVWSDADFWNRPDSYTTIQFQDLEAGDWHFGRTADVCGRWVTGFFCARSWGTDFDLEVPVVENFSDMNGWNRPEYYTTIKVLDVYASYGTQSRVGVCGRGRAGLLCQRVR